MIYRQNPRFKKDYSKLPKEIQKKVKEAYKRFRENPSHPSLQIKPMQGQQGIWEGRITASYRFTFEYDTDPDSGERICIFRRVGAHDIEREP